MESAGRPRALHLPVGGSVTLSETTRASSVQPAAGDKLTGRNFVLVCLTNVSGYLGNGIIMPVLPLFLVGQGYTETFVGLVLGAFNVSSFSARPAFGRWVDAGQPRRALITSMGILSLSSAAYLAPSVALLFLVRMAHGLGWAGLNAVGTAWIAILAPLTRRAEAMGYYTMSQSLGAVAAPALGLWLLTTHGAPAAFLGAAGFSLLAMVAAWATRPETVTAAAKPRPAGGPWLARFVEPSVFLPTAILTLVQVTGPAIYAYIPLYFLWLGVSGVEWFYVVQGLTSIFARAFLGQWGDRVGRVRAMVIGFAIQASGLLLIGQTRELPLLILGGAVFMLGVGVSQPSLYALAADRAPADRRGSAMATYTMGFQLGGGIGAVVWGITIEHFGYPAMYAGTLVPMAAAFALVLLRGRPPRLAEPR